MPSPHYLGGSTIWLSEGELQDRISRRAERYGADDWRNFVIPSGPEPPLKLSSGSDPRDPNRIPGSMRLL